MLRVHGNVGFTAARETSLVTCCSPQNEAGNAPCFTWSWNSGSDAALGLSSGSCRLLAFMDAVSTISVAGVYSGYHKAAAVTLLGWRILLSCHQCYYWLLLQCWVALQTYSP